MEVVQWGRQKSAMGAKIEVLSERVLKMNSKIDCQWWLLNNHVPFCLGSSIEKSNSEKGNNPII